MVLDNLKNMQKYKYNMALINSMEFIKTLSATTEDRKYEIDGDKIFAIVMSYNTKSRSEAVLESHKKYVDIQAAIVGSEGMEWFPSEDLKIETPYSTENDVMFYEKPSYTRLRFDVNPGEFAIFFPTDAHMPQLMATEKPNLIKKVVVKIGVDLLALHS